MNKLRFAFAASLLVSGAAFATPTYLPFGAQANVALGTVTNGGWTQCYSAAMASTIGNAGEVVLDACQGDYIMMAGRESGSQTLLALAATTLAEALIDTGDTANVYHLSNGANWWYSDNWSWGFAGATESPFNFECGSADVGMCLHTLSFTGGYSINRITGLNGSTGYEKMFFVADRANHDVPEPGSLALVSLALLGSAALRRQSAR